MIVLEAEEMLEMSTAVAIGSGTMGKNDRLKVLNEWQKRAKKNKTAKLSKEQSKIMLASIGIGVEWAKART